MARSHAWVAGTPVGDVEPVAYVDGAGVGVAPAEAWLRLFDFTQFAAGGANFAMIGLSFSRTGTDGAVQNGANILIPSVGVDVPRIGRLLDADPQAWVVEGTLNNAAPRDLAGASWLHDGATTVLRPSGELGPDGTDGATYLDSGADSDAGAYLTPGASPFAGQGVGFVWVKRRAGTGQDTGQSQITIMTDAGTVGASSLITVDQTWQRQEVGIAPANQTYRLRLNDNVDRTALGGGNPGATKNVYDFPQLHTGQFNQEWVNGVRNTDRGYCTAIESLIDSGNLIFVATFQPKATHLQYGVATGIFWWYDANNLVEWDRTTSCIRAIIAGTTYLTPVAMSWAKRDLIDLCVAVRNGQPAYAAYRKNWGAGTLLSTGSPPTLALGALTGTVDFWCGRSSGAGGTPGRPLAAWVRKIGFKPAGLLPDWAP